MKETKDFEKKLKRLEEIVASLENQEHPLEKTVSLFQEGMKLSRDCRKTLAEVELSIKNVIGLEEDGTPQTADLELKDNESEIPF